MADLRSAINAANYVNKHGYKTEIRCGAVIVFDPVRINGEILDYKEIRLRDMGQAIKFVTDRS